MIEFFVNINLQEACDLLCGYVQNEGFSTSLADRHYINGGGQDAVILVFEKYYMRTSNRASLTVTLDNINTGGAVRVHAVGSGGGRGTLFSFDWGTASSFEEVARDALMRYIRR